MRGYRWCLSHLKLACKKLNISTSKAFHALRASYAVYLLRSGVDVTVVKELLGHETLVMVLRYAGTEQKDLFDAQARGREFLHAKAREARQSSIGAR
jgi:site-specific recombinase XerD